MLSGLHFLTPYLEALNEPKRPTATRSRFDPIPEQGSVKPGARPWLSVHFTRLHALPGVHSHAQSLNASLNPLVSFCFHPGP